jgi:hypothetical protein
MFLFLCATICDDVAEIWELLVTISILDDACSPIYFTCCTPYTYIDAYDRVYIHTVHTLHTSIHAYTVYLHTPGRLVVL